MQKLVFAELCKAREISKNLLPVNITWKPIYRGHLFIADTFFRKQRYSLWRGLILVLSKIFLYQIFKICLFQNVFVKSFYTGFSLKILLGWWGLLFFRENVISCACFKRSGLKLVFHWGPHASIFFRLSLI